MTKKILKITGVTLVVIIGLLVATPFFFKGRIVQLVKDQANTSVKAKINFSDDIGLSIFSSFPNLNLSIKELTIVGVDEFAKDTLANIPELNIVLDIHSIINGGDVSIKKIHLDQPKFVLKVIPKDSIFIANWDIMLPSPPDTVAVTDTSTFRMLLDKITLTNASVLYDDQELAFYFKGEGINAALSGDMTGDKATLDTKLGIDKFDVIFDGIKYMKEANTEVSALLGADFNTFTFTFKENEIRLNELFLEFNGFFAMPDEGFDMDIVYKAKKNEFKNFLSLIPAIYAKDFADIKTSGTLALDGFVKGMMTDSLSPAFGLNVLVENAQFQYPDLPKAVKNIGIDLRILNKTGNLDHTVVDLKKCHVEMGGNPVDMTLFLSTPVSDAQIKSTIKGKINLATVKEFYPLDNQELNGLLAANLSFAGKMSSIEKEQYQDFTALGSFLISDMLYKSADYPDGVQIGKLALDFSPQQVNLSQCMVKIGKNDISATGKVDNLLAYMLQDAVLKGQLTLSSTYMNLNDFMSEETTEATSSSSDTAALSVIEIPKNIDFSLTSTFGKLVYDNIEMTNAVGNITIKDQTLFITNLKTTMLSGTMAMTGYYETKNPAQPKVDFNFGIQEFDFKQTFETFNTVKQLAPIAQYAQGKFSTTFNFNSLLGSDLMPIYTSMMGKGTMKTSTVTVEGTNLQKGIVSSLKMDKYKKMVLDAVNLTFDIVDGKVFVKPFDVKLNGSKATIAGSNSFDQTIDYLINLDIPRGDIGNQAQAALQSLSGFPISLGETIKIDLAITGDVKNPKVKPIFKGGDSMKDALKDKAQAELDKKKAELEAKAKAEADKLKGQAQQKIDTEKAKLQAEADKKKAELEAKAKAEADKAKKEAENKLKEAAKNKLKGLY